MSRLSAAERVNLSWLVVRGALNRLVASLARRQIFYWPLFSAKADRLVIAPQDLRTADATRATEIYAGRFAFAGKTVTCDARSPFDMVAPSDEWAETLLGFGWLRHLRAAESGITRANALALVNEWMSIRSRSDPVAWRPDVVARRIMSFLCQSPLILHDADMRFYRKFLRSLARQVRYLRRSLPATPDGVPRFQAVIALASAALCMSGQSRHIKRATRRLVQEIERQILPDGGHISRNPNAVIEILFDLLPLRQVYTARNLAPPPALLNAIDRMMPMLRFFRHGDGNFALFNGMGPTPHDALTTILAYDDARGAPVANAAYSGYQRVEAEGTVLLMETGAPPPLEMSQEAHAGCLSFELSARSQRIVVNCGLPSSGRDNWRQVARATAAHATVVFNDTSSAHIVETQLVRSLMRGAPLIGGPKKVDVSRAEQDDAIVLTTSHDGYADRFGIVHQRTLALAADGRSLQGRDIFVPDIGASLPEAGALAYDIRFHLHPLVKATRLTDGDTVMLVLPNRDVWTFETGQGQVALEESVHLAGLEGPRRTTQIVVSGDARTNPDVRWSLSNVPPSEARARRRQEEEPELPL